MVVYIVKNDAFKDNWYKIGYTKSIDKRMETLYDTSVPLPFEKVLILEGGPKVEHDLHKMLHYLRINSAREFFRMELHHFDIILGKYIQNVLYIHPKLLDKMLEITENEWVCHQLDRIHQTNHPLERIKNMATVDLDAKGGIYLMGIRMVVTHDKQLFVENKGYKLEGKEYYYASSHIGNSMRCFEEYDGMLYPHNCHISPGRHDREDKMLQLVNEHVEHIINEMYHRETRRCSEYRVGRYINEQGDTFRNLQDVERLAIAFYNKKALNENEWVDYTPSWSRYRLLR